MKGNEIGSFLNKFIDFINDIGMKLFYLINNVFIQPGIAPEVNGSSILLTKFSFAFLLLSMLFYWFQTTFKFTRQKFLKNIPSLAMWLANITLAIMLTLRWIESGHFPLSNLYESLLFLSWSLTSIHLFLERALTKGGVIGSTLMLGAITSPLILFTNAFATFSLPKEMQKVTVLVPALQSNWLIMHVSVMMISYAALLSGSLLAIAFLVVRFVGAKKDKLNNFTNQLSTISFGIGGTDILKSNVSKDMLAIKNHPISYASITSFGNKGSNGTKWQKKDLLGSGTSGTIETLTFDCDTCTGGVLLLPTDKKKLKKQELEEASFLASQEQEMHKEEGAPLSFSVASGFPEKTEAEGNNKFRSHLSIDLGEILDNLSYRSIGLGFAFLTIGIFSGAVWANEAWGSYWSWDPKETWAFITWLVFALYLHTRLSRGWIGKESALVATFGFLVIWFCYLGVNLFGKGLHSYGWFSAH